MQHITQCKLFIACIICIHIFVYGNCVSQSFFYLVFPNCKNVLLTYCIHFFSCKGLNSFLKPATVEQYCFEPCIQVAFYICLLHVPDWNCLILNEILHKSFVQHIAQLKHSKLYIAYICLWKLREPLILLSSFPDFHIDL